MYSRLYTNVLNQYHSVDFCSSFHHCYLDSGLFGISISVHPSYLSQTPQLLANQFDSITRPLGTRGLGEGDLRRARNQLKSSLAMALESRMVQVEDLGVRPSSLFQPLIHFLSLSCFLTLTLIHLLNVMYIQATSSSP